MTRIKFLLAALCTAAVIAIAPAGYAQCSGNVQQCPQKCLNAGGSGGTASSCLAHVVGDGSSAQFLTAGIAADSLALTVANVGPPTTSAVPASQNCSGLGDSQATYHWSFSNGANILDERSGANILPQLGNIWVVWIAACSDTTGSTNITDIWTDVSEDSTVGNRTYFSQQPNGPGATIEVIEPAGTAGGNSIAQVLMPDQAADVALPAAISAALGTSGAGTANLHVNVGMTDIRPEDALYATQRSNSEQNTKTYAGLGYTTAINTIGSTISTAQQTQTFAQPVSFGLGGGTDPILEECVGGGNPGAVCTSSKNCTSGGTCEPVPVPSAVTIPIGAAPTVLYFSNQGDGVYPVDVKTGVVPNTKGGTYPLAHLFDGTTDCNNANPAFDLFYNTSSKSTQTTGPGTPSSIFVVLREPLSGTMNTTEFNLFRTYGNPDDSQEAGINPSVDNPLDQPCAGGGGNRERAIGTGEVVNAILGKGDPENKNARVIGYIFDSYANRHKLAGSTYNYLTEDGVDPIGPNPTTGDLQTCGGTTSGAVCADSSTCSVGVTCSPVANLAQNPPNCNQANTPCPAGATPGGASFPNLRNGTYKSWSIYRWVVANDIQNEFDPYGPAHLAYAANNVVDTTVADYVPFAAGYECTGGTNNGQYCYNSGQCTGGGSCQPIGTCTGGNNAGAACSGSGNGGGVCTGGGYCTDGLQVYRSHFERCISYKNAGKDDGMSATCLTEQAPDNGPVSAFGTLGANGAVEVEAGGDVGGLVAGSFGGPEGWCPVLDAKNQTVTVTNGSMTVTLKTGFDFTATSSGNAAKYLLELNLVAGNTIWINGSSGWADYTISSVNTDKSISLSSPYVGTGTKAVTEQACFELNSPGMLGVIN